MRLKYLICLFPLLFMLISCSPIYQTNYSYLPPKSKSGQMCLSQCQARKESCDKKCAKKLTKCQNQARQTALYNYTAYESSQKVAGQPVQQSLNDFYDDSSCQTDCGCGDNYNTCFTSCGGQIIPQTVCVAFCNSGKK